MDTIGNRHSSSAIAYHDGFPWRLDVENIPKGEFVETKAVVRGKETVRSVFRSVRVIVAINGFVTTSAWLPPQKDRPNGRWEMLSTGQQPEAWMPYPEYPEALIIGREVA